MVQLDFHPYQQQKSLQWRVKELRQQAQQRDPAVLAEYTGATFHAASGELELSIFGVPKIVSTPDFVARDGRTGKESSVNTQALLLYHFCTTNGAPLTGRWISFRELPGGGFYHQAFQGYTGNEIVKHFGNDLPALEQAALDLGGHREEVGDATFVFQALPRIPLMVVYWLGDEDFPSSARILFDSSAGRHLPTDVFAILGSAITRRLIG